MATIAHCRANDDVVMSNTCYKRLMRLAGITKHIEPEALAVIADTIDLNARQPRRVTIRAQQTSDSQPTE